MGVRILHDRDQNYAALYCSTSDVAFGPLFDDSDDHEHDAEERALAFLRWLPKDARQYDDAELQGKFSEWLVQEPAQWQREKDAEDAKNVDDDEIEDLKVAAQQKGNDADVMLCDLALQGDETARARCYRVILDKFLVERGVGRP
jgi:hypothetical protein